MDDVLSSQDGGVVFNINILNWKSKDVRGQNLKGVIASLPPPKF